METFSDKLWLSIIDKALIGVILLCVGYYVNRTLEAFKSKRAIENELIKMKHTKLVDYMDRQLSQFYWPLYIRLHIDQAVWERILDKRKDDELLSKVADKIESDFIIKNHEEIVKIIESNIHLMESDGELFSLLKAYLRHVAVYKAMRSSGCNDKFPFDLGEPWPKGLLKSVTGNAYKIQKKYDDLLEALAIE